MARESMLRWWHSDSEVLPENLTENPYTKVGTTTGSLLDEGGVDLNVTGAEIAGWQTQLIDGDTLTTGPRPRADIDIQVRIEGVSATPAWAGNVSPIGMYADDGVRNVAVSIGSTLQWVNPSSGAIIAVIKSNFGWTRERVYRLRKDGTDRWRLWVDGELVSELAYDAAVQTPYADIPEVFVGNMDPGGTSRATYEAIEVGTNRALPPEWLVDRFTVAMPVPIRSRWNSTYRGLARTALGMVEDAKLAMRSAWRALTAARVVRPDYLTLGPSYKTFVGDVDPTTLADAWILLSGAISIVRERVRFPSGAQATLAGAIWGTNDGLDSVGIECDIVLRESVTLGSDNEVGPFLGCGLGRDNGAALMLDPDGVYRWHLWDATTPARVGLLGGWQVDPYQVHRVGVFTLRATGFTWLVVDGQVVDVVSASAFKAGGITSSVIAARYDAVAGPDSSFDVANAESWNVYHDRYQRPLLRQAAMERLNFLGGCEINEVIELWNEHHHGMQGLRGTTQGILIELVRMTCSDEPAVVADTTDGDWYLEVTYPEVTPIWLEFNGTLYDVYAEFPALVLNFTLQEFADLVARYLLPRSVLEFEYYASLAATMTAGSTTTATYTELTVNRTTGFEVGDAVDVRNAANTVVESSTVTDVVSSTVIRVEPLNNAYVADDRLRKVLAQS